MEPSTAIGSSIFLYIVAFIAVMCVGGYLTYRTSSKRKQRREEKRNLNNQKNLNS
ncbi:hypothetical protein [Psychrobacter sp.]|uniref:hypothetical protein n=1 Tax=Psychrobacter sp. TaxID=56811 RepID=UPI002648DEDE|nr:hypothetical protein [Psychrobacter sp.]MDN6276315.1 hypothetical protein [Psychrobacter sp.]MDN6308588.1 hypothetical protein [Psychrobacter sp.]